MIQSMTGYGSASDDHFTVEIRSLNHRFLDISIKMPPFMGHLDIALRGVVREHFSRGKFDIWITPNEGKAMQLRCNMARARSLHHALVDLQRELSLSGSITLETFSAYRDILIEEEPTYSSDDVNRVFQQAIAGVKDMRITEGMILSRELKSRVKALRGLIDIVKSRVAGELERLKDIYSARLKSLLGTAVLDESRILQEAAIMAERLDISEEISRIESHLTQMSALLDDGETVGKKLDFIVQEINREINTLAGKSADYAISAVVIDMKTDLEKIREQVQNIQ